MNSINWWFRLYLFPFFKKTITFYSITLFSDFILSKYNSNVSSLAYLIPFYVFRMRFMPGSFSANLEFHKSNINFRKLRLIYISDILLSPFFWLIFFYISALISRYFSGFLSTTYASFFWEMSNVQFLLLSFFLFVILVGTSFIVLGFKYTFLGIKHRTFFMAFVTMMPIIFFSFFSLFLIVFFGVEFYLVMLWTASSLSLASIIFKLRAFFHQANFKSTVFQVYSYTIGSMFVLFFAFYLAFISERQVLYSSNVDKTIKIRIYKFYVPFVSNISFDLYKDLEKHLEFRDKIYLYQKLSFDPSKLGLNFFLDDSKEQKRLQAFLRFGKPNKEFLTNLFHHIDDKKDFWRTKNSQTQILNIVFYRWPKNEKMPEILSDFKVEHQSRIPAKSSR